MPLIVLEGLDGAGKSTQLRNLKDLLEKHGKTCEYLHFPRFDSPVYGDMVARFLRGEFGEMEQVNPYIVALLFAGDRADASAMLKGWLDEGKYVLLDRYVYSNVAYQCAKLSDEVAKDDLKKWILETEFEKFGVPRPDMSLFLDVPFNFTLEKLTAQRKGDDREYLQGGRDIHEESLTLQQNVREMYLKIAHEEPDFYVINCSGDDGAMGCSEDVFAKISALVEPMLGRSL